MFYTIGRALSFAYNFFVIVGARRKALGALFKSQRTKEKCKNTMNNGLAEMSVSTVCIKIFIQNHQTDDDSDKTKRGYS